MEFNLDQACRVLSNLQLADSFNGLFPCWWVIKGVDPEPCHMGYSLFCKEVQNLLVVFVKPVLMLFPGMTKNGLGRVVDCISEG
ncbi:hypothetical protein ACOMHN_028727 [Nucella lapillus]